MRKKILMGMIFLIILCLLFTIIQHVLWLGPTPITYFYKEPENSIDVIYLGASNTYAHFNSVLAFNLFGYTTSLLSADSEPFIATEYLIKEATKYQNPSLFIIDVGRILELLDSYTNEEIRVTLDSMKFSNNRINAINNILKYKKDIKKSEYINFYFSFFMYHNKWKKPDMRNIFGNKALYKGYIFDEGTIKIVPQESYKWNNEKRKLNNETEEILNSLIEYLKSNNLQALFVVPVRYFDNETQEGLNTVIEKLNENNLEIINFNTLEDFNLINVNTDFYNQNHINVYGATKYTLYFGKYLKEHYNLANHKNDEKYKSWNEEYERFKKNYNNLTNKDFNELLNDYNYILEN